MNSKEPLEFDISVSADKKRRKKNRAAMSGAVETSSRRCEHPNCSKKGMYRAPKSPDHLDEFYWFCREHARQYNLNWDFFKGQSKEEVEKALPVGARRTGQEVGGQAAGTTGEARLVPPRHRGIPTKFWAIRARGNARTEPGRACG